MTIRIGIAGIKGRMGRLLAEEVPAAGAVLAGGTGRDDALTNLAAVADIVIDFTHADTVVEHARALSAARTGWVLGTTGFSSTEADAIKAAAAHVPIIASPNFSAGVNLMLMLAEQMGAALPAADYDVEILEMHHRQKVDAPSGTALGLGRAVAAGRGTDLESLRVPARDGLVGARRHGEIGFASLRGGQIVGRHSVIFTAAGEQISLSHDALERRVFATGAVRAALWLSAQPPGLYSMKDVLSVAKG